METSYISEPLIEHVKVLAKCDISKEDLTDAIEYFRGKYIVSVKNLKKRLYFYHRITIRIAMLNAFLQIL